MSSSPLGVSRSRNAGSPPGNETERSFYGSDVESMNAVEQSKRIFLQSFGDYIESIKRTTEVTERQSKQSEYEQRLYENCKKALGTAASDTLALPPAKVEYKHLPSLIENARSYTTSPKYAEWQTGINNSLPLLEEAFNKLRALDIPSAEKDIIEPVKTAVNTPFMQMIKCKDKQRDMHSALTHGMVEPTYAGHMKSLYGEFQTNHKERKVRQALELVKRIETAVQAAETNFTQRLESYVEAKKLMSVPVNPSDPLSLQDYEPVRNKAISLLETKLSEVSQVKSVWESDLKNISTASKTEEMIGQLKVKALSSRDARRRAEADVNMSNDSVQKAWEALMEAQTKAAQAEKLFIATKLQEEMDTKMVENVTAEVESQKSRFAKNVETCNQYTEVLRLVQKYINARWEPFKEVVKTDSKGLVVEVCEVFSVSEKVLGDLIDRKQAQVDHASKEEKDCLEKYHRKWDLLDPNADQEKARAHEAQAVKETAQREVERLTKLRQGMRDVLQQCRPVIEYFGISVDAIERGALIEEWDKRRVRVYKEFEDMLESCVVRVNVMGQTPDAQLNDVKALAQEEYKRLNTFLLGVPAVISAPVGCQGHSGVDEKQRITVGDMIMRVEYMCKELDRHGASHKMLETGLARLKELRETLSAVKPHPPASHGDAT